MSPQTVESPRQGSQAAHALLRDGAGLPPLRAQLSAGVNRLLLPGLRQGPRHRLRLRARRAPLQRGARAPSARRTSGASRSCCRSSTPRRRRGSASYSGHTPLIHADRLGAELGLKQPLPQGRLEQPPEPLLQGPGRLDGGRPPARAAATTRSAASRPATSAPRSPRSPPRPASTPTSSTPTAWRRRRRAPAGRSAPRSASSTATTTKPTAPAASSREATGIEFANITLRPFYAEGAKTVAFEIVEQLDWQVARPHRHPGRRRHALLARAQGAERARDARPGRDRRDARSTSPSRAAATRSRRAILAEEAEIEP